MKKIGVITKRKADEASYYMASVPSDLPEIAEGSIVYIGFSSNFAKPYEIKTWRNSGKGASLTFKSSINEDLLEKAVFVEESVIESSKFASFTGEDVGGYEVFNNLTKEKLGIVMEIWEMPAQEVYVVETEEGRLPIPAVDDFIIKVDNKNKKIFINMIEGIKDLLIKKK